MNINNVVIGTKAIVRHDVSMGTRELALIRRALEIYDTRFYVTKIRGDSDCVLHMKTIITKALIDADTEER